MLPHRQWFGFDGLKEFNLTDILWYTFACSPISGNVAIITMSGKVLTLNAVPGCKNLLVDIYWVLRDSSVSVWTATQCSHGALDIPVPFERPPGPQIRLKTPTLLLIQDQSHLIPFNPPCSTSAISLKRDKRRFLFFGFIPTEKAQLHLF